MKSAMNKTASRIIGASAGPRSIFLAEVLLKPQPNGPARPTILNLAEFVYLEGLSLSTPVELGKRLGEFLKTQKFSTKELVIGLPARSLLTRKKDMPPATPEVAAASLRLQAEAEFPTPVAESDSFAVDYAGQTNPSAPSNVLLVATAQSVVHQCSEIARTAGLKLRGITATGAALGRATANLAGADTAIEGKPDDLILSFYGGAVELIVQHGPDLTQIRNLSIPNPGSPESIAALAGEIRRSVALLTPNGSPISIAFWDDSPGNATDSGNLLGQRLGMPVASPSLRGILANTSAPPNLNAYAPAVAVAITALESRGLPVDFLHSRLAPPPEKSSKRPVVLAIAAGVVLLLGIIAGVVDLQTKQSTLDALIKKHNARASEIAVAETADQRLRDARKATVRKPRYSECLVDLTKLFPDEGNTIWATRFTLSDNNKGLLTGKAVSEPYIRTLMHNMLADKQFINPTLVNQSTVASPIRGNPPEHSFSISFTYKAPE
jgi:hypothetical protein